MSTVAWHTDPDSPAWQIANPGPGVCAMVSRSVFGDAWTWGVWHLLHDIDAGMAATEEQARVAAEAAWRQWAAKEGIA